MAKKLRIGIIGTGGIAHAHMMGYTKFDDVEIVAGADIVPGKARAFLDQYKLDKAEAFESADEMLKNVQMDGVTVCTYNTTHAECVIKAFEAGLHVQCEKPMSFTLQEAAEMVRASKKANKILTIGFQPRYDTARQYVDDFIASGTIGKVYYVQSGGGRRHGIPGSTFVDKSKAGYGCLGDIGCYSIDECLHAISYPKPLTVSAMATNYFGKNPKYWGGWETFDVDDFSTAFVRMEGDTTFIFKQAWDMHADSLGDTLWLGTEGGVKICNDFNGNGKRSRIMYFCDINGKPVDSYLLPNNHGQGWEDCFVKKVRGFCDAVINNLPAPIPGEEILYNQAICDGIYRSSILRKEVDIEIPAI